MKTSSVFNAANKLKDYSVLINEFSIEKELIISMEMAYSNRTPRISGDLVLKDLYDLNAQISWKDAVIHVEYMDIFDAEVKKDFRVLDINEYLNDKNERLYSLELQDTTSYTLEHSYLSKSFNSSISDAIGKYLDHLGISEKRDFTVSPEKKTFAIPRSMDNLRFFETELSRYGFRMYQTKKGLSLKSLGDLLPSSLPPNDPESPYLDETDNQLYKNKIYDIIPRHTSRKEIPPKTRAIAYDPGTKSMLSGEMNDVSSLKINANADNLQDTVGMTDVVQSTLNFDQNRLMMKEGFMNRSEIVMVVNGYVKNDLNQVYNLRLRGVKGSVESQSNGNVALNGKWVSSAIVDKIVGDSLVQKVTLNRADTPKRSQV